MSWALMDRRFNSFVTRSRGLLADQGAIWVAADQRVFRYGPDLRSMQPPIAVNRDVRVMLRGRDGTLWVGTANGPGVLEPQRNAFRWLTETEGQVYGEVHALAEDQNGELWVGSDGAGAVRT